ncbi:acyltransferase family protein [Methylobacterium symbioticum]|uniref:Acyltransferase 3 domain-containing protein n=1 Tax=Methylobacterium symbioticum TaxID=2584084 RepID=A0A509EBS8_9HYPH|nr:acyltransferase family protein [Methylobacterium symbioticum]VUD71661.1 hypothetical protein MET9862_02246 [Methylobacterium symbioticum]
MISYRFFGAFRLLLAVLVLLQHFLANIAPEAWMRAAHPYAIGEVAVLAFFALSGFVISEAIDRFYGQRPVAFLLNRLLRIVPHFVVAMLISLVVHGLFLKLGILQYGRDSGALPEGAFSFGNVALNLLSFLPALDRGMTHNFLEIAWTIRVEMMFYALACLGIALPSLGRDRMLGVPTDAAAATLIAAVLFALALAGRLPAMFLFVPHFAFGVAAYLALKGSRGSILLGATTLVGVTLTAVHRASAQASVDVAEAWLVQTLLLFALLAVMCFAATVRSRRFAGLDQTLGRLTFPLYLSHQSIQVTVLSVVGGDSIGAFAAAATLSLATAVALSALVDPAVDRLRDVVRGHRLNGAAPDAAEAAVRRPAGASAA